MSNFLFGHGSKAPGSDVGYINLIYTYGLFIFVYFVLLYLFIFYHSFKKIDTLLIYHLSKIILISIPIVYIKQFVFGNSKGLAVIIMIIIFSSYFLKKSEIETYKKIEFNMNKKAFIYAT